METDGTHLQYKLLYHDSSNDHDNYNDKDTWYYSMLLIIMQAAARREQMYPLPYNILYYTIGIQKVIPTPDFMTSPHARKYSKTQESKE